MLFFKLKIFRLSDCGHEPSDKEVHIDEYVNGTETKTPDGKCYVCEWAMSVPVVKVTVIFNPEDGNYYTDENFSVKYDGEEVYANAVLFVRTVEAVMVEAKTNNFSYGAIPKKADNAVLVQADFEGTVNSFLKIQGTDLVTYRTSNNCIQNKDDGLKVYFAAGGSLSVKFASTGGSNKSKLGLKDEKGNWIAGATSATEVKDGIEDGNYEVTGTTVAGDVSATCTVTISEPPQTIEVTHTLDVANLTAAGLAVGSGGAINTTIDGFTNGSVKLSNKVDGYISSNGGTITFTTQSDNAVFKIKFQAKASTRGITISGPEGFSASQYETAANTEFTIELGKAGTYTINTVGGEVKFFYMSYTHMEPIVK